jgi:hypothetical protein
LAISGSGIDFVALVLTLAPVMRLVAHWSAFHFDRIKQTTRAELIQKRRSLGFNDPEAKSHVLK